MTSQYDSIASKYNAIKTTPPTIIESSNFKSAVLPILSRTPHARVLDLACGTGYYSHQLPGWGAAYVLGVDLSPGMVAAATAAGGDNDAVRFRVGNVLGLGRVEEEGFDLVTGVWLLNYAADAAQMTDMIRTVSENLRPGGSFVAVVPYPVEDVDALAEKMEKFGEEKPGEWGVNVRYPHPLESGEGWRVAVNMGEDVRFRAYHLKKSVYERAVRAGGMRGELRWKELELPREAVERMGEEYWKSFFEIGPHMGVMIVEK